LELLLTVLLGSSVAVMLSVGLRYIAKPTKSISGSQHLRDVCNDVFVTSVVIH